MTRPPLAKASSKRHNASTTNRFKLQLIIRKLRSLTWCPNEIRPVHLLRVSLLRVLESNFPGDSL